MKRATRIKLTDHRNVVVSIHARVKRATIRDLTVPTGKDVSIHARVKRATIFAKTIDLVLNGFNPRPREAGDGHRLIQLACLVWFQSTPA